MPRSPKCGQGGIGTLQVLIGRGASQLGSERDKGVDLLLTPEQAEALAHSEALGNVALVLAPNAG